MRKQKLIMLSATLVLAAAIAVGGTLAYYSAEVTTTNVVTMGNVAIELVEDMPGDDAVLLPDGALPLLAFVKNTGEQPVYVRAKMIVNWSPASGAPALPGGGTPFTLEGLGAGWFAATDGYVYYNQALTPGTQTPNIYQTLAASPAIDSAHTGMGVNVTTFAEGVQAENVADFIAPNPQGMITTWNNLPLGD